MSRMSCRGTSSRTKARTSSRSAFWSSVSSVSNISPSWSDFGQDSIQFLAQLLQPADLLPLLGDAQVQDGDTHRVDTALHHPLSNAVEGLQLGRSGLSLGRQLGPDLLAGQMLEEHALGEEGVAEEEVVAHLVLLEGRPAQPIEEDPPPAGR